MSLNKFTPCRKVGLSRKKNTPLKTVESLLVENVEKVQDTPKTLVKAADVKPIIKNEVNPDTPCRQVGLSRKRKNSTPIGDFKREKNVCSSKKKVTKEKTKLESINHLEEKKLSEKTTTLKGESKEDNHTGCAKKLSNLFNSPSAKTKNSEECTTKNNKESKAEVNCDTISSKLDLENRNFNECSMGSVENRVPECIEAIHDEKAECNKIKDCDKNDSVVIIEEKSFQITGDDENLSQFIKVCYSNEKENKKEQGNVLVHKKPKLEKNSKFSGVLIDDDDDFEIGPKKKKIKKLLERSKTEVDKKEKKSKKNEFKKSLSVGDSRSKAPTESLRSSNTSSLNSLNNCFVKLEKIKEIKDTRNICLTPQDLSDDDFEVFSCTPKETKIKNLDSLEKEVEEKRQILEELKRAKLHKKMHSTTDLKELTSRWKIGCIDALQDLLKQLNMHTHMDMPMLLKKLNIPDDFVPSSQ